MLIGLCRWAVRGISDELKGKCSAHESGRVGSTSDAWSCWISRSQQHACVQLDRTRRQWRSICHQSGSAFTAYWSVDHCEIFKVRLSNMNSTLETVMSRWQKIACAYSTCVFDFLISNNSWCQLCTPVFPRLHCICHCLWPPCIADADIIFLPCSFFLSSSIFFFYSSPNLSSRKLDVYHTSTHGVALVQI